MLSDIGRDDDTQNDHTRRDRAHITSMLPTYGIEWEEDDEEVSAAENGSEQAFSGDVMLPNDLCERKNSCHRRHPFLSEQHSASLTGERMTRCHVL